jgi:hypothetical protein
MWLGLGLRLWLGVGVGLELGLGQWLRQWLLELLPQPQDKEEHHQEEQKQEAAAEPENTRRGIRLANTRKATRARRVIDTERTDAFKI